MQPLFLRSLNNERNKGDLGFKMVEPIVFMSPGHFFNVLGEGLRQYFNRKGA